jgi:hypothetical protein
MHPGRCPARTRAPRRRAPPGRHRLCTENRLWGSRAPAPAPRRANCPATHGRTWEKPPALRLPALGCCVAAECCSNSDLPSWEAARRTGRFCNRSRLRCRGCRCCRRRCYRRFTRSHGWSHARFGSRWRRRSDVSGGQLSDGPCGAKLHSRCRPVCIELRRGQDHQSVVRCWTHRLLFEPKHKEVHCRRIWRSGRSRYRQGVQP